MTRLMYKLSQYKTVLAIGAIFMMSMLLVPQFATAAIDSADIFGIKPVEKDLVLGKQDIRTTIANVINISLSLLGIVTVVIVLIGGFKWMTAGGNDDQTAEARKWIFSGIIGLAIIMSAWAIARFVLIQLSGATNITGGPTL